MNALYSPSFFRAFCLRLLAGQDETQQLSIVIKQQEVRPGRANEDEFCLVKATQAKLV